MALKFSLGNFYETYVSTLCRVIDKQDNSVGFINGSCQFPRSTCLKMCTKKINDLNESFTMKNVTGSVKDFLLVFGFLLFYIVSFNIDRWADWDFGARLCAQQFSNI